MLGLRQGLDQAYYKIGLGVHGTNGTYLGEVRRVPAHKSNVFIAAIIFKTQWNLLKCLQI